MPVKWDKNKDAWLFMQVLSDPTVNISQKTWESVVGKWRESPYIILPGIHPRETSLT